MLLGNPIFLIGAAIVSAVVTTVLVTKNDDATAGNLTENQYDIIVIGSGIAGTSAAYDLASNGNKVLILQAEGYVGGRTKSKSVTLMDNSVFWFEEGANWIHGRSPQNPLTELATKVPNVNYIATDDQNKITFGQDGVNVDSQIQIQSEDYESIFSRVQQEQGVSAYDALLRVDSSKATNKYFMHLTSYDVQFQTSSNLMDLSAQYGQDDSKFDGQESLIISRYQAFPEYLSQHQNIKVLLNHAVNKVTSNGLNSSTVACSNGKSFTATKVVIAVPLGVLKRNTITFSPVLPDWKVEAIQKLRMGNVCKVLIVPKDNLGVTNTEQYIGVVQDDIAKRGSATYFANLAAMASVPAYMTFGLGPNSDEIENMSETELKALIARRMNAFSSGVTTDDFDIVRSKWRGNPNVGGAYTYSGVDTYRIHWQNMARPVFENGWYFCGEHTSSKYRGTVHGAFLTGKHTSEYIRNNSNDDNWSYADRS